MASTTPHESGQSGRQHQLDDRQLAERWPELDDDDWEHLPIIRPGTNLEPSKVYFDLNHPERGTFRALGRQEVTEDNCFVPQDDLDPELWRVLTGG